MRIYSLLFSLCLLALGACEKSSEENVAPASEDAVKTTSPQAPASKVASAPTLRPLDKVLEAQPDKIKERYPYRHPAETLTFFGIEPGMTVVEVLPGGGWYSKILLPLLGEEGKLIGADYPLDMWPRFGFMSDEQLEEKKTWANDWPEEVANWNIVNSADVDAFVLGTLPEEMHGTADAVLFIRAMHNLARYNVDGNYLDTALQDAWDVLKPGGFVGIVQHEAREDMPDDWASGQNGYLKKSFVMEKMQAAGFEIIGESAVNQNPKDQPSESDVVWRLPPGLYTSKENPELREEMKKIGESNRMTLKFKKPE